MSPNRQPAVAVVAVGEPTSPSTWSGTTAGVLAGLGGMDVRTHAIDLTLPSGIEQAALVAGAAPTANRFDAESAVTTAQIRSRLLRHRLRGLDVDGVIQVGTTFAVPQGVPFVTLEDMTLRQALQVHPVFSRMSTRAIGSWERRRAAIYARARRCTVASHWAKGSLEADYAVPSERIAVVGLGANHTMAAHATARSWSSPRFLFIGIDWERKGGPLLLRAFAQVHRERPDAVLDVVGGHPPIEQPGVRTHGVLSQSSAEERATVAALFAQATCLVMPSLVEPFGIVHVEAALAGIPSIGSAVGGPRDLIGTDGGLVVDPHDAEALRQAMSAMADPERAQQMGAAAVRRAALYTWPRVAERLLRALDLNAPDGRDLAPFL